jgi:uncharacterized protein (DUF433 family)
MNNRVIVTFSLSAKEYGHLKHLADEQGISTEDLVSRICGGNQNAKISSRYSRINIEAAKTANVCAKCGATEKLDAHHIDLNGPHKTETPNNNFNNLIPLCHKCHMRIHYGTFYKGKDIIERHANGETFQSIADSYGLSRQRVHQIFKGNVNK